MRLIQFTASQCWRGHEQKIIYLYEAFEALNYVNEQWIICPLNSEIYKIAIGKNMNVFAIDSDSEFSLKIAKELSNFASINKADIVFIHSSKAHTISVIASVFFGLKTPLVLCRTLIKRVDTNFFRKWKYNYKGIKKIICVSQPVVDVLKFAVKNHKKLSIVGSVIDVHKFTKKEKNGFLHKEFKIPNDYKIIGNIAAFTSMKDIPTWVMAAKILVNPIAWSESVEEEGKVLYERNCQHCHGATGAGDGKAGVVYKGVPNYASDAYKNLNDGHIFHVITHGKGRMWSHKSQTTPEERWKIVHYVHRLQLGS